LAWSSPCARLLPLQSVLAQSLADLLRRVHIYLGLIIMELAWTHFKLSLFKHLLLLRLQSLNKLLVFVALDLALGNIVGENLEFIGVIGIVVFADFRRDYLLLLVFLRIFNFRRIQFARILIFQQIIFNFGFPWFRA